MVVLLVGCWVHSSLGSDCGCSVCQMGGRVFMWVAPCKTVVRTWHISTFIHIFTGRDFCVLFNNSLFLIPRHCFLKKNFIWDGAFIFTDESPNSL